MNYLIYQFKVAILLSLFYGIYRILLKNSVQFRLNRFFILCSLFLSMIVPFIKINIADKQLLNYAQLLPEVIVGNIKMGSPFSSDVWINSFVLFTLVIFILLFIYQFVKLFIFINSSQKKFNKNYILVLTNGYEAFSFFRFIVLGKLIPMKDRKTIIQHEKLHIRYFHSIDIVIYDIFKLMQWFNPFLWLFGNSLKENHEFEVDRKLINQGVSMVRYQELLMNQLFQSGKIKFSSFNHNSLIKNRINMMKNSKGKSGKTRFLLATVLSLFIISVFAFRGETINENISMKSIIHSNGDVVENSGKSLQKDHATGLQKNNLQATLIVTPLKKDTVKKLDLKDVAYLQPEVAAQFQGKDINEFVSYVATNVKYPTDDAKKGLQGKVYIQFSIEKDGSIKTASVIRSSGHQSLDNEAVRVILSSPKWTPASDKGKVVKQIFTIPVVFSLK